MLSPSELGDLAAALSQRDRGGTPCHRVRTLVAERLAQLETRLRDLTELRGELRILLREWDRRLARIPARSAGAPPRCPR